MLTRPQRHPAPLGWITAATSFGFVVVQLDVTVLNVALPRLGNTLHASVAGLQWFVDGYALAFAALLLSAGVLSDRFGARRAYVAGFAVFALASVACGLAGGPATLIAARAVQGAGAALLVPASLALLNEATAHDARARARAVGLWTAAGGVSIAAGPVLGGLLLSTVGWRSIFLVNLPLCAAGIALTLRCVPSAPAHPGGRRLDLRGQALAIVALTGLVGGVIELHASRSGLGWSVAGLAIGLAAASAFVAAEARSPEPMLPLPLLRVRGFSVAVLFGVLLNFSYYGLIFVLTLYLQRALGFSAWQAGLAYLPLTATFIVSNPLSGWAAGRFGPRLPMVAGGLANAAGFALLLSLGPHSRYRDLLPGFTLIPLGMGLAIPAMTTSVLASVPRERSGLASALLNAARQSGGAAGVALFGAFAGEQAVSIVSGLSASAAVSTAFGLAAAGLAAFGLPAGAAARRPVSLIGRAASDTSPSDGG